jgi:hypothetical protein
MSIIVTLPYNPTWTELAWAKKHCPSYITNQAHSTPRYDTFDVKGLKIDYYFRNEKEALMFRLRWV